MTARLILAVLLLTGALLSAQDDALGGRGAPYLRMGIGGRAQAMGNAHTAFLAPTTVMAYWNPAMAVFQETKYGLTAGYRFLSLGRRQGHLSFGLKVPPRAAFTIAMLYHGDGQIPIYDGDENKTYEGGFSAFATHVAIAYKIHKRLSVGLNTTLHHASLTAGKSDAERLTTSEVGNFDLSAYYEMRKFFAFGINIKEIKSSINWEAPTYNTDLNTVVVDTLPVEVKLGSVYKNTFKGRAYAVSYDLDTYVMPDAHPMEHHVGAEFFIDPVFPVRLGIATAEGFSFGAGFFFNNGKFRDGKLDYVFSIEPNGSGLNNGVSWTYGW